MKFLIFVYLFKLSILNNLRKLEEQYDLVIIGGGLAGLTSAFESNMKSNNSLKIALIEQSSEIGGNSKRATSGINFLETEPQKKNNIIDNYTIFYSDTMKSGKYINNPSLVNTLIYGAKTLYDYYTNNFDVNATSLGILGGHSVARTHRPTDHNNVIGSYLINKVSEKVKTYDNIKILCNTTVNELLKNETTNEIYGLKYKKESEDNENVIYCKAIILTSGGYGHDFGENGLLKEFVPQYMNYPTTNGELTLGSGIKLGRKIGADLVDMDQVQIHPTGFVDSKNRYTKKKFLAPELLRGVGGILINEDGERFCNELGTRDYVTNKILENCQKQNTEEIDQYESFLLMNQEMANEFGNNFYFYKDVQGFILEHNNFSEMANDLNISYNNLENTINEYNEAFDKKLDKFNKTNFPYKFDLNKTVYSMIITPSIHYTMGGLKMNNKGEILNTNNESIKGLYGAGEVTGGVHGGNRLGGNSLAECGVFGRISADSAVDYISNYNKDNKNLVIKNRFFMYKRGSRGLGTGEIIGIIIPIIVAIVLTVLGMLLSILSILQDDAKEKKTLMNNSINIKRNGLSFD